MKLGSDSVKPAVSEPVVEIISEGRVRVLIIQMVRPKCRRFLCNFGAFDRGFVPFICSVHFGRLHPKQCSLKPTSFYLKPFFISTRFRSPFSHCCDFYLQCMGFALAQTRGQYCKMYLYILET